MDNKERLINLFLDILDNNEEVKQYISVDEARRILNENIENVIKNENTQGSIASYDTIDKIVNLSSKVDINRMNIEDIRNCVHELLHALTTKLQVKDEKIECFTGVESYKAEKNQKFKWQMNYSNETGRGLNEGITEWMARKLVGEKSGVDKGSIFYACGINWDNIGVSYSMHQLLVQELAILYGEDKIINAYLSNDISIITESMSKINNSQDKFAQFTNLLDSLLELHETSNFISNDFRQDIRGGFSETQDFFVKEFLEKEINIVLESNDKEKIQEMKEKLEHLLALNVDIKGKGSPFKGVVEKFNEQVKNIGQEYEILLKKENIFDKIKKSFSKGAIMDKVFCIAEPIGNFISKHSQQPKVIAEVSVAVGPVLKPVGMDEKKLTEEIRGYTENDYKEACQKAQKEWEGREEEKSHRDRNMEIDLF